MDWAALARPGNVEDRRDEPADYDARRGVAYGLLNQMGLLPEAVVPPVGPLSIAAGVNDIRKPTDAEILKYMLGDQ